MSKGIQNSSFELFGRVSCSLVRGEHFVIKDIKNYEEACEESEPHQKLLVEKDKKTGGNALRRRLIGLLILSCFNGLQILPSKDNHQAVPTTSQLVNPALEQSMRPNLSLSWQTNVEEENNSCSLRRFGSFSGDTRKTLMLRSKIEISTHLAIDEVQQTYPRL
ncbi:hypothetical protein AAG906_006110 [Vitis piasezkii]